MLPVTYTTITPRILSIDETLKLLLIHILITVPYISLPQKKYKKLHTSGSNNQKLTEF